MPSYMIDSHVMAQVALMGDPSPDEHVFCCTAIVLRLDELVHAAPRAAVEVACDDDRQPHVGAIADTLAEIVLLVRFHKSLVLQINH